MLLAGYAIAYEPRAVVRHSHDYTLRDAFRRFYESGYSARRAYAPGAGSLASSRRSAAALRRARRSRWLRERAAAALAALRARVYEGAKARRARHRRRCTSAGASRAMSVVCAFVLTRNRKELLVECVRALLAQTHPVDLVIVLDNASTDGTRGAPARGGPARRRARALRAPRGEHRRRRRLPRGRAAGDRGRPRLALADGRRRRAAPRRARDAARGGRAAATPRSCAAVVHPDGSIDLQHRCRMGRFITPLPETAYEPGRREEVDVRVVRRAAHADAAPRARPACRSPSSSSATTTPSTRCGCASTGGSGSCPRARSCTRCRSAAAARRRAAAGFFNRALRPHATRRCRGRRSGATSTGSATSCGSSAHVGRRRVRAAHRRLPRQVAAVRPAAAAAAALARPLRAQGPARRLERAVAGGVGGDR